MATCSGFCSADDGKGNALPFTVTFALYDRVGSSWVYEGTYKIPSGSITAFTLPEGKRFKAVPRTQSGWVTPADVEFVSCNRDIYFVYTRPCPSPNVASIRCSKDAPKIGEEVVFTRDGEYGGSGQYIVSRRWDFGDGGSASTSTARHTYTRAGTFTVRFTIKNDCGKSISKTISVTVPQAAVGPVGFEINIAQHLTGQPLIVWHVVKVPGTDLWFSAYAWVRGTWDSARASVTYKVKPGDLSETATPALDYLSRGTLLDGTLHDGDHCVVLARDSITSLKFGFFKSSDVYQIHSNKLTKIGLSTTSSDVISSAIMSPVCRLFGIPSGRECEAFWGEMYDPIFLANYASIVQTGKDTLGNTRELTAFDHLALPFAVLGVVAPNVPLGKFVSSGLKGAFDGAAKFSDAAYQWMKTVTINVPPSLLSKHKRLTFMESIVRLDPDRHIDEVMHLIEIGHFDSAKSKIRQYLTTDFGKVDFWEWKAFNNALYSKLDPIQFSELMDMIHGFGPQIDSVVKTASKASPSSTDVAKVADAMGEKEISEGVLDVIMSTSRDMATTTADKILKIRNILKNNPAISRKLIAQHKSILDKVLSGGTVSSISIKDILAHATIEPDKIAEMLSKYSKADLDKLASRLTTGFNQKPFANFIEGYRKYSDVMGVGTNADTWLKNNAIIAGKAMESSNPAKMADIPKTAQDFVAEVSPLVDDMPGTSTADELLDATKEFVDDSPTSWRDKGIGYVDHIMERLFDHAKGNPTKKVHYADSPSRFAKWKSIYRNLEDWQKFTFWTMIAWGTYEFAGFYGGYVLTNMLGIFPGQATGRQIGHNDNMETAAWQCKAACDENDAATLVEAIDALENAITEAEKHLNANKREFELNKEYNGFKNTVEGAKLTLQIAKDCLSGMVSTGSIKCTSNQSGFYVFVDGQSKGHSYGNTIKTIDNVPIGSHKVKIEKGSGYSPTNCEKTLTVREGRTVSFDCQMTKTGACTDVTNAKIYITPLDPKVDEEIAFNGAANSSDAIRSTGWRWDFGDGSKEAGQAVEHRYKSDGIYTVELVVTNVCGSSTKTARQVVVSEEGVTAETTTLTIQEPVDENGVAISGAWTVEIWVDGKYTKCKGAQTLTFGTGVKCDCKTPYVTPCELGHRTITLKKSGYADTSKSFDLEANKPATWYSPVMKTGVAGEKKVVRFSVPKGSNAWVDGNRLI